MNLTPDQLTAVEDAHTSARAALVLLAEAVTGADGRSNRRILSLAGLAHNLADMLAGLLAEQPTQQRRRDRRQRHQAEDIRQPMNFAHSRHSGGCGRQNSCLLRQSAVNAILDALRGNRKL